MDALAVVSALLFREALLLDRKDWAGWLALYDERAEFWVPAWRNEDEPTNDPDTEVSLIYHDDRYGLEERVARIGSRKSVTAMPLPRTTHLVGNVLVEHADADGIRASAAFTVHLFDVRAAATATHFGRYEVRCRPGPDGWRFAAKKVLLMNDRVASSLDFYAV